ncbi:MAG: transglutaminaseTgpA domain-containing protein [Planctomycetota bacterium]|nr:transglutaminaseTgpA domain-containing protein [Planctomycetota bacterium]MDA1247795.1 transglutaminaseTgpA domain-containing protein [Planctomycetota bacterium]
MTAPLKNPPRVKTGSGRQKWIGLALLCVEIGATGYLGRTLVFSLIVLTVALIGAFSRVRLQLDRQRNFDLIAGLGIIFSIRYLVMEDNLRYVGLLPSQQIAFTASQFFLTVQAMEFFIRRNEQRLPVYFPGLGVGAMVCAAIVEVSPYERDMFQLMCVGFAIFAAAFADASRQFTPVPGRRSVGRPLAALVAMLFVGIVGWWTATLLHRYEKAMDRFVMQFLQPSEEGTSVGFSDTARLGSVSFQKDLASNEIALRIESQVPPGYLRGKVFDEYHDQQWLATPSSRVLKKVETRPSQLPDATHTGNVFHIANLSSPLTTAFTVWPSRSLSGTFFSPGGVRYVDVAASLTTVDAFGILRAEDAVPGAPYSVFTDESVIHDNRSSSSSTTEKDRRMATPPAWAVNDPQLRKIAEQVFADRKTPRDKIGAVLEWFRRRGQYSKTLTVPPELKEDVLAWFLKENPPAHCEFFASGATILLRMGGVRCRYVTGFLATELNRYGGSWTARNRDAHAWVEAWDGQGRWIVVETTPVNGVPTSSPMSEWQQFREYASGRMQRFRAAWQQRRFGFVKELILSMGMVRVAIGFPAIGLLVVVWVRHRRARHVGKVKTVRQLPIEIRQMQKVLRTIDRVAQRVAGKRGTGETLLKFADRLEAIAGDSRPALREAAGWYRDYSTLRYASGNSDENAATMQREAKRLLPELRRVKRSQTAPSLDRAGSSGHGLQATRKMLDG